MTNPIFRGRWDRGWTQGELAERTGLSRSTIQYAERDRSRHNGGKTVPRNATIRILAEAFEVPFRQLRNELYTYEREESHDE
jgi:transcriptional regulator with XRE-family HTH domain